MSDIEAPIRNTVKQALGSDFEIFEELDGVHKHGGERVRYDLVARPKQHLVERGFHEGWFVIEVKRFNLDDRTAHDTKARDMLWQCVVYSFSQICLPDDSLERPLFVLYYIAGTGMQPQHENEFLNLCALVQRGGVGRLTIDSRFGWSISFLGSHYFRQINGKGPHNVGVKRQTGSSRKTRAQ